MNTKIHFLYPLLIFLISGNCVAMEKAAPVPAESQERVIVPFPDGLYQSAPPDLKRLLLEYILALETNSSVFHKVGELRGVSRQWREFLYDPVLLKKIFQRCQYPETVRENPTVLGCLGSYVGSLVAKTERTPFERDFIDMLRLNAWNFNDVLSSLFVGPHCTLATLRSNPDLLQAVLASFIHVLATCTAPTGEIPCRESKVARVLIGNCGVHLQRILTDTSIMIPLAASLRAVVMEVTKALPDDQNAEAREMLSYWAVNWSPTSSEKLSYGALAKLMLTYMERPREFKALEYGRLFDLIKAKYTLSKLERAFLTDVCNGKDAQCIERVKEKQVVTPELLDVALLLAAKSGNASLVRSLMEMTENVVRQDASLNCLIILGLLGRQLYKLDHGLFLEFIDYLYKVFIKPRQNLDDFPMLAAILTMYLCSFESTQELDLFCAGVDKLYEKLGITARLPGQWLQACFDQDEALLQQGILELRKLSNTFCITCLSCAASIIQINDLKRTKELLLSSEFGPAVKYLLEQQQGENASTQPDFGVGSVILLENKMKTVGVEDLMKPYWVDSFIDTFAWSREEQLLLDATIQGERDTFVQLLVSGPQKPLFLEVILLCALRHGKNAVAEEVLKRLTKYPTNYPECKGQDFLIGWARLFALQQGNEELWNAIKKHCPMDGMLRVVCACGALSRQGFLLATKEYLNLVREREGAMLYSQEWVDACWNQDSESLRRIDVGNIDHVFLTWACKTGRLILVKYLMTKDYMRAYVDGHREALLRYSRPWPQVVAYLKSLGNEAEGMGDESRMQVLGQ